MRQVEITHKKSIRGNYSEIWFRCHHSLLPSLPQKIHPQTFSYQKFYPEIFFEESRNQKFHPRKIIKHIFRCHSKRSGRPLPPFSLFLSSLFPNKIHHILSFLLSKKRKQKKLRKTISFTSSFLFKEKIKRLRKTLSFTSSLSSSSALFPSLFFLSPLKEKDRAFFLSFSFSFNPMKRMKEGIPQGSGINCGSGSGSGQLLTHKCILRMDFSRNQNLRMDFSCVIRISWAW